MKKIILGILLGVTLTFFVTIYKKVCWSNFFTEDFLKAFVPIIVAAVAGIVAIYQVRSNILVSYRIRWIENFKLNLSEYISKTHLAIFSLKVYSKNKEKKPEYYDKYFDAINDAALYRNRIFLELNPENKLHEKIIANMVEINSLLDKFIDQNFSYETELEISVKQTELEMKISELLESELSKSKKIFEL